jgi:hypothetical protein
VRAKLPFLAFEKFGDHAGVGKSFQDGPRLDERQKSRALLAPATEGTDPRLHQGERRIMGDHLPKSSSGTTRRNDYVPPQPDLIVVLLIQGDPGEGQIGFFYLTPVGQERRLPVAGRGAYDANLAL